MILEEKTKLVYEIRRQVLEKSQAHGLVCLKQAISFKQRKSLRMAMRCFANTLQRQPFIMSATAEKQGLRVVFHRVEGESRYGVELFPYAPQELLEDEAQLMI